MILASQTGSVWPIAIGPTLGSSNIKFVTEQNPARTLDPSWQCCIPAGRAQARESYSNALRSCLARPEVSHCRQCHCCGRSKWAVSLSSAFLDAVAEAHALFKPCETFPRGPIDLEQLQSQAEAVTERAPDRPQGGRGHAEFSLCCTCLSDSRVQDLLAGESSGVVVCSSFRIAGSVALIQSTRQLVLQVK